MEVNGLALRLLLEATQAAEGIAPERFLEGFPAEASAARAAHRIDWSTFVAANERAAELVGHDPERLRRIGDGMLKVPSFSFLPRIARLLVSPAQVYDVAHRWLAPSLFPGLTPPTNRVLADGRMHVVGDLPSDLAPCEPFLHIFTGNLRAVPTLLGLPPAIMEARVWPRHVEVYLRMPASHTLVERARRSLRALRGTDEVLSILEDQRRQLEEGYSASLAVEGKFRELLDKLPTLVMIHRAGRISWVNGTFVTKLGFSRADEVIGRTVLELTEASSRDGVGRRMSKPVGAPVEQLTTVRLLRRDGQTLTIEVSPAQGVDFGGGPARLVAGVDVTERVHLQQRLVTADRIASIGLLGAGVAHEINNPLAYALASVEVAAREVARVPGAPPQIAESLATALEGLGRVRTIVRDLRVLARDDDGKTTPTDVREVLESTLTLAASALEGRAGVVRDYREVPLAAASGPRLGQVALNLVLNAIESMPPRGEQPGEVRVRTLVDDSGRVAFEVEDTGAGIAPEAIGRIFDPFFTTKPVGSGTGLGLAICHQIVAGFGGEITVRSTPGRGSTFRVALPSAEAASGVHGAEGAPACEPARRRVLVVDDEPHLVTMIERMLRRPEYEIVSAFNGSEALERVARDEAYDVVLCDLMMAGMSGMEFYDELRRSAPRLVSHVVFMTGGAFTPAAREFLARVPNRCLEKPFTIAQLESELLLAAAPRDAAQ